MLALLLAAAASAAPTSPPAAEDVWRGTMSYPCTAACQHAGPWLCRNVPIEIAVDAGTYSALDPSLHLACQPPCALAEKDSCGAAQERVSPA